MTEPAHAGEIDCDSPHLSGGQDRQLNYAKIRAYWRAARPSILGPYMMDGFGFPRGAGHFRFRGERKSIAKSIGHLSPRISVLDLGSGAGFWTEFLAQRFARVVSVEASPTLFAALEARTSRYPNVCTIHGDALSFEPQDRFGLVFLGGLLMYLNDADVRTVLSKLARCLEPDGVVLCRESTVRQGTQTLVGDYQVVYRSVETYRHLSADAGFDVARVEPNIAYLCPQMACELIKSWKTHVPERFWCLPVVGRLAYWGFRLGYPWNARLFPWLLAKTGRDFPALTNHFFVLRPTPTPRTDGRTRVGTPHSDPERQAMGVRQ